MGEFFNTEHSGAVDRGFESRKLKRNGKAEHIVIFEIRGFEVSLRYIYCKHEYFLL